MNNKNIIKTQIYQISCMDATPPAFAKASAGTPVSVEALCFLRRLSAVAGGVYEGDWRRRTSSAILNMF
jgi:hypothetical protein